MEIQRLKLAVFLLNMFAVLNAIYFTISIHHRDSISRENDKQELMTWTQPAPPQFPNHPDDEHTSLLMTKGHTLKNDTNALFRDPSGRDLTNSTTVKIVAFTDMDYMPVAKWWYKRMVHLGYTTHTLVVIDSQSASHFQDINKKGKEHYRFEIKLVDPGKRRKNKVRSLWYNRILYCLTELQRGQSLLLTDVDNIFLRYEPLSQFVESEYDIIYAFEGKFPNYIFEKQGFVVCGGLIFLRASSGTISMMEMLLERCDGGTKRCDDQVEWNKLLIEVMVWNSHSSKQRVSEDGLLQYGFDGVSKIGGKGFKAMVWDRDFAWRGPFDTEKCPSEKNWVSMPGNIPFHIKKKVESFDQRVANRIGLEKMARVIIWEAFCGINATNRNGRIDMENGLERAFISYKKWQTEKAFT